MIQVNRSLDDKAMDRIDHALGRPLDPMGKTYRNYYATTKGHSTAKALTISAYWYETGADQDMLWFGVNEAGRKALRDHLKAIKDPWRLFVVTFDGREENQVAKSHSKARYSKWIAMTDAGWEISFGDFCKQSRVRLVK